MSLFVGRLPLDIELDDLDAIFQKYGRVLRRNLKRGDNFAYGFVDFAHEQDMQDAVDRAHGMYIGNTKIVVERARTATTYVKPMNTCYSCGEKGHYSRQCPKKDMNNHHHQHPSRRYYDYNDNKHHHTGGNNNDWLDRHYHHRPYYRSRSRSRPPRSPHQRDHYRHRSPSLSRRTSYHHSRHSKSPSPRRHHRHRHHHHKTARRSRYDHSSDDHKKRSNSVSSHSSSSHSTKSSYHYQQQHRHSRPKSPPSPHMPITSDDSKKPVKEPQTPPHYKINDATISGDISTNQQPQLSSTSPPEKENKNDTNVLSSSSSIQDQ
ncbi:hypothetical protein BDA99DRAFT_506254 [Phascolomyces articulosus]|uniref:Uncharacterized protein n=1 Tax=Phascolomyces articulosus TaxID=60185 RepID=A0AAD5KCY5_9FUNG|nr:hypothetical protein BDA99DRAFT_506254 [Phascolomyces articulosus]